MLPVCPLHLCAKNLKIGGVQLEKSLTPVAPPPCAVGHALPRAHTHACVARASLEVASAETVVTEGDGALTLAASCRLSVSAEPEDGAGGTKAVSGVSARGCGREAEATYKPGVDDAYLPQAPPS